jgi:hypothetical protein
VQRPAFIDASATGTEHINPADTFGADYGRLLKRAYDRRSWKRGGVPNGIRTRVLALKGPRPGPLDDGDAWTAVAQVSRALDNSTQAAAVEVDVSRAGSRLAGTRRTRRRIQIEHPLR